MQSQFERTIESIFFDWDIEVYRMFLFCLLRELEPMQLPPNFLVQKT